MEKAKKPTYKAVAHLDRVAALPRSWDLGYLQDRPADTKAVEASVAKVLKDSIKTRKNLTAIKAKRITSPGAATGTLSGKAAFFFVTNNQGGALRLEAPDTEPLVVKIERASLLMVEGYTNYILEPTKSRQRVLLVYSGL